MRYLLFRYENAGVFLKLFITSESHFQGQHAKRHHTCGQAPLCKHTYLHIYTYM